MMMATINGVTVMGTPEEINTLLKLQQDNGKTKSATADVNWMKLQTQTMSGTYTHKCPNEGQVCFCTGACMGMKQDTNVFMKLNG